MKCFFSVLCSMLQMKNRTVTAFTIRLSLSVYSTLWGSFSPNANISDKSKICCRFIILWNWTCNRMRFVTGSFQHCNPYKWSHIVGRESENNGLVFALSLAALCVLRPVSSVWDIGNDLKEGESCSTINCQALLWAWSDQSVLSLTICFR